MLQIEPDLMKTVCINLLDNAKKGVAYGSGSIDLCGESSGDEYVIKISDNGKGLESCELSRITEAFYVVDKSRARLQGGVGLDLAICAEIIKLHGASMEFESEVGRGTCVTVKLKGFDSHV